MESLSIFTNEELFFIWITGLYFLYYLDDLINKWEMLVPIFFIGLLCWGNQKITDPQILFLPIPFFTQVDLPLSLLTIVKISLGILVLSRLSMDPWELR